jgi:hypothetical protein
MTNLQIELLKGVFTLAAVALGSLIALLAYFRQKQYELAKQRYLEEGVDAVAAEVEHAMGVVSHNYARALQLCRAFRDYGERFDAKELERGFLQLDNSNFRQIAHHRVGSLLQSQIVWHAFQTVMAHLNASNSTIAIEIPDAMRLLADDSTELSRRKERAKDMLVAVRDAHDSGLKHAALLGELHALALLVESKRLSLKAVAKFSQSRETRALVTRLEAVYPSEG